MNGAEKYYSSSHLRHLAGCGPIFAPPAPGATTLSGEERTPPKLLTTAQRPLWAVRTLPRSSAERFMLQNWSAPFAIRIPCHNSRPNLQPCSQHIKSLTQNVKVLDSGRSTLSDRYGVVNILDPVSSKSYGGKALNRANTSRFTGEPKLGYHHESASI